jgi:branched-chain amino acid transport system substrate-binding protein
MTSRPFGRRRSRTAALACVAAAALALTACSTSSSGGTTSGGGGSGGSGGSKSTYTIGYTDGITGQAAAISKGELDGLNAAFNAANAAGGVNGHKIKLTSLDAGDDPSRGATNTVQLIKSDHALAVLGLVGSPNCSPTVKLAAQYKTPIICGVADTSDLKPVHPYVYTKYGSEVTEAKAMISVVTDTIKPATPKLGFVFIDFPSAREWATTVRSQATAAGLKTVAFDGIAATTSDLSTEAARLRSAGANVVLTQIISPQVISLNHAFKAQKSDISMITEATTSDYPTLKSLADPSIYQLMLTPLVDPNGTEPAVKAYVAAMAAQKITGYAGINGAELAISYTQGEQIIAALKKCGDTCTGATLNTALQQVSINLPGVDQNYSYTTARHYPQTYFTVARYDDTKKDVVNSATKYYGNPIP